MTKEEVLQKVTDYCNEKSYTSATLTDAFKDKFADHFQRQNPEGDINDEAVLSSMKFALNTAFSSASELATVKTTEFTAKENAYKTQIEELKKKTTPPKTPPAVELPEEITAQLEELKKFKNEKERQEKLQEIIKRAKEGIRKDLHASFDSFASDYEVDESDEEAQATYLTTRFQEIFRDSIGDIKPLAPKQEQKRDEEFFEAIKDVKVTVQ